MALIQLTSAERYQARLVPFSTPVDSEGGVSITFDFYAYGGSYTNPNGAIDPNTGGDGLSFFFLNGTQLPSQIGGTGGGLGYAPRNTEPGLNGAYLGVGIDEFGNFSSPGEGRVGGIGRISDSIAVRGSQSINYLYLDGTTRNELPISIDNPGLGATRENSKRTARIDLEDDGDLSVFLDLNLNGTIEATEKVIELNVINSGNGPLPETFRFGFAASTGDATNIHEIDNFRVTRIDGTPIPGDFTFNQIIIGDGNANDVLTGASGNDLLVSTRPLFRDTLTGGPGADRFVFSGTNKKQALKTSTFNRPDRVTDFKFGQGDRFQLDYDNNLATITPIEIPKKVFNAGKFKGNLRNAVESAYADKNHTRNGDQALKANESVFFQVKNKTYLSVNNNNRGFSTTSDLFVDVTGIKFKAGDIHKGTLVTSNYFAVDPIV